MIRLDLFVFGYIKYTVADSDIGKCAGIFLKHGINVSFNKNTFLIRRGLSPKIDSLLSGKAEYKKSEILGLYGFLYRNRKRYGAILAILITVFLILFSSDVVWDVRIEGCLTGAEGEIRRELSDAGFGIGSRWSKTDKSEIEVEVLERSECVSWININRRGTVAYVTVVDKHAHKAEEKKEGYSNVIAACDAVIEEITVKRGVAVVKAGDTVKKGDILISGIISTETGGGFCYAEGTVIGRVSDTVSVVSGKTRIEKVYEEEKKHSLAINFFGKTINIFKSYRNFNKEYDIIESNNEFVLFGVKLPVSFLSEKKYFYSLREVSLSDTDMIRAATALMQKNLESRLADASLFEIRTEGDFTDNGYRLTSYIVMGFDIGEDLAFSVSP